MGILATTRKGVSFRFESRRSSPQPISADSFHATPTKNPANSILLYMNPIRPSNHLADCTRSPLRNEIPDSQTGVLPRKIGPPERNGCSIDIRRLSDRRHKKVPAYGFRRPDSKHIHIAGHGFMEATVIKKRAAGKTSAKRVGEKRYKRAEKRVEGALQSKRIS